MSNLNVTELIDWQMKQIILEFHFYMVKNTDRSMLINCLKGASKCIYHLL
jgi:uncharacterized protein VirK/YbjX